MPAAERETAAGSKRPERRQAQNSATYAALRLRLERSRVAIVALIFTAGEVAACGAPGWPSPGFRPHQPEQFLKSHPAGFQFRQEQFAHIIALGANDVRTARLAQRFSCWLLLRS
jgi:hypothetical protein